MDHVVLFPSREHQEAVVTDFLASGAGFCEQPEVIEALGEAQHITITLAGPIVNEHVGGNGLSLDHPPQDLIARPIKYAVLNRRHPTQAFSIDRLWAYLPPQLAGAVLQVQLADVSRPIVEVYERFFVMREGLYERAGNEILRQDPLQQDG